MDWSDVAKALPAGAGMLANVLAPGSGVLVSSVGTMIAHAFGVDATPNAVASAISMDPASAEKLAEVQENNKAALSQAMLQRDIITMQEDTKRDAAAYSDVQDARKTGAGNESTMIIAGVILVSFAIAMIAVLIGCWQMIVGKITITPEQAGMFAAITGLVGSIVGYFASNAQTVINYLFGGSLGGRKNAETLSNSVASMGDALGKVANSPTPTTMIDSAISK
jgi:hypothetical protein